MKKIYLFIALLMSIVHVFAQNEYSITATALYGYGTVTGSGVYHEGDTCTITAIANEGYEFSFFNDNNVLVIEENPYTFVVHEDHNIRAGFKPFKYRINVSTTPDYYGYVTGAGTYDYGETCSLMAQFYDGYDFEKWTENGIELSTNPVYRFTVSCDRNIKAHFFKRNYTITASVDPEEGGVVEGGGIFTYGESCTLKTFPRGGYDFVGWKKNNNTLVSINAIYVFDVTQSANYIACYEPRTFNVFVNANPSNGGFVSGNGSYQTNQECTVTAIAAEGFRFVGWTEESDTISFDNNYTFTVDGNSTLVANFIPNTGVKEQHMNRMTIFPNPVNDMLTIKSEESITLLEIYSFTGTLLFRQENCANKVTLSLSDLPSGTYFVKITSNMTSKVGKFVK